MTDEKEVKEEIEELKEIDKEEVELVEEKIESKLSTWKPKKKLGIMVF